MQRLTEQMLEHAQRSPEGVPLAVKGLLHLGNRVRNFGNTTPWSESPFLNPYWPN
jgi:hypothetical protein